MKNLELITTEAFGEVNCDFYRNVGNEIFMTREQIGTALEYANPVKAIQKIHLKHKDRLDALSIKIKTPTVLDPKLGVVENLMTETTYYSEMGIMEICRWSRQPKANNFMDWAYSIVQAYRNGILNNANNTINPAIIDKLVSMNKKLIGVVEQTNDMMKTLIEQNKPMDMYVPNRFPVWTGIMMPKFKLLKEIYFPTEEGLKSVYKMLFEEFNDTYGRDALVPTAF